jgi:N-acetylmuramoyl-L-alanine amidase
VQVTTPTGKPSPFASFARKVCVVIDPGHGGTDPGAIGKPPKGDVYEKNATLALAQVLRKKLNAKGGLNVKLTREDDRLILLGEISRVANELCPNQEGTVNRFVSLHFDAAAGRSPSGRGVYFSEKNRAHTGHLDNGVPFAQNVANSINNGLPQKQQRGVHPSGFAMLQGGKSKQDNPAYIPHMPTILVEGAFMSNPFEAGVLGDALADYKAGRKGWFDRFATILANGIEADIREEYTKSTIANPLGKKQRVSP